MPRFFQQWDSLFILGDDVFSTILVKGQHVGGNDKIEAIEWIELLRRSSGRKVPFCEL